VLDANASPRQGFKPFGFSTEPRSDGTRGMIQVSLLDFSKDLGFSLHAQDVAALADTTLPLCEQALQTFDVTLR
jgi:hypothetical protein